MKKILLIFLSFIFSSAIAIEKVATPVWSEFCPREYLNAKIIENGFFKRTQKPDTAYWANRHDDFNFKIKLCESFPTDNARNSCLVQVRIVETDLTARYNFIKNNPPENKIRK